MNVFRFVRAHKWPILLAIVGMLLFYWYEIRPIVVYRTCAVQASTDARSLLASKAEIAKGTEQGNSYKKLLDKGMYLRTDYESFLQKCLLFYGFQLPTKDGEEAASSSSAN